jgi:glycosyltransferase involved in cell wall biosynthesis
MSPITRNPDRCAFRRLDDTAGQQRFACTLVSRALGFDEPVVSRVERMVCEACCRHPLPIGPRLNPVVAAALFSAAERAQQQLSSGAPRQAELEHARQFAMRWLATVDERGSPLSPADLVGGEWDGRPDGDPPARELTVPGRAVNSQQIRVGLVGSAVGFGLAHQNRDIALHLGVDRWLIRGPRPAVSPSPSCRLDAVGRDLSTIEMEAWLDGLDAILFVERPIFPKITRVARRLGVAVVCVPNWEWLSPGLEWLENVHLMLCPTRHTTRMALDWKQRFGFEWDVVGTPWPIDVDRFEYRQRRLCRRFVYVHGSGGVEAVRREGSETRVRRKGLAVMLEAARQIPRIPLIVYAFPQEVGDDLPANVELRTPPDDNRLLYCDGDVCVQPSHWEGLGLPLLECQAAGMPLITTDAPPMNEHQPLAVVPAETEAVSLSPELCIPAARIQPHDLAAVLRSVHGRRIGWSSRRARRFVERHHSWVGARPRLRETIYRAVLKHGTSPLPH